MGCQKLILNHQISTSNLTVVWRRNEGAQEYPFGIACPATAGLMPGRHGNSSSYRYGFNGMEKDDNIKGAGNSYDFGARMYDSRLGRWLSIDPKVSQYVDLSPYSFAGNTPVWMIDTKGEEPDRNQAGTIDQAAKQWASLKNQTVNDILKYIQTNENAVRYVYTEKNGWVDLQHYFGTLKYGKASMDMLEEVSGIGALEGTVFPEGVQESYYSYEDLPTNAFAESTRDNLTETSSVPTRYGMKPTGTFKEGQELIDAIVKGFENAEATEPTEAPNWEQIPFKDHTRKRLPIKGWVGDGWIKLPIEYSEEEQKVILKTGDYVPQNHSEKPYDLDGFPAADTSIEKGDRQKGNTGY